MTDCFSVVPESFDQKLSPPRACDGSKAIELRGADGTAILFNAGIAHYVTTRSSRIA
ncbi:MAG: hypothetical protein VX910_10200 [Candidatus Latescibacterota bacterium]|nr:hypothetical protein [Candidatus Latescibacterota bacterium]